MELRPGNAQWIGRREEQQDSFGFAGFDQPAFRAHAGVLVVLADGMGGMSNGREAGRLAVQQMMAAYREKGPDESIPDALMRGLTTANRSVYDLACGSEGEGNVGTTLVAAAVRGEDLFWVAVGDSRLYLYRHADGSLTQCTQDHNHGNELLLRVAAGELSRETVASDPDREALTSFVGMAEIPQVDRNLRSLALAPGDRLLLCSDGVHGVLGEAELQQALTLDAQPATDALIAAVKAKAIDTQDNATAAVLVCAAASIPEGRGGSQRRPWRAIAFTALGVLLALGMGLGIWLWTAGPHPTSTQGKLNSNGPADSLNSVVARARARLD
ncbi:protein phosphatase 2C domain-containing protein [uncultured Thiodictyon sp.]|jgi:protein phosphatase|uniref:PP2C family protein-serine/threonine phosphatase n=1 Tax=uncultured Thiodictyon sp. TaxID=1846217 RepID=UPI0025F76157|nr:protein phosphatase 2C domain-containing protein [uncultured Thiodictyon sp.]